ncbi:uncharacterized protein LOC125019928 isoform X8 [Mugil cephalus]|uniref:uncharacterized protein LOC125019928 isoform X8 n=1 Tax=Mugil cephalus TaxID=48193 RepID=UPI001FB726AB|nr:uncharacterized protein LOC125019928 isoform X8 [Mugil cephalus]
MFLLVFVVLLGTVVTVNSDQPEVELFSDNVNVGAETGRHRILTCRARGFNTSDIVLNIKKNHCVLTEEDGVETSGVKPYGDTYWRRDNVIILKSDKSHYSCEVSHTASSFRVVKVWDPDSVGGGRIISSMFKDTTKPALFMFPENSEVQTKVILVCLASGFYPNNIILKMKRNGRILTTEDGVKSSGFCSNEDNTFQRSDSVEIKRSDQSDYSCEVIHDASGSHVEKIWDHRLPDDSSEHSTGDNGHRTGAIIGAVIGGLVLLLVVVVVVVLVVLRRLGIRGAAANNSAINYIPAKSVDPAAPSPDDNTGKTIIKDDNTGHTIIKAKPVDPAAPSTDDNTGQTIIKGL